MCLCTEFQRSHWCIVKFQIMETCIICKNKLGSNYATIGDKGRSKLVESSKAREDGLYAWSQTKDPLKVHTTCCKSYTRDNSIKAAAKKKDEVYQKNRNQTLDPKSQYLMSRLTACSVQSFYKLTIEYQANAGRYLVMWRLLNLKRLF